MLLLQTNMRPLPAVAGFPGLCRIYILAVNLAAQLPQRINISALIGYDGDGVG